MKVRLITAHLILLMSFILTLSSLNIFAQYEDTKMLKEKISQYAPFEIRYDSTLLTANEKICVEKLFQASRLIDSIFLKQVYSKNIAIKKQLESDPSPAANLTLEYFNLNMGPFDRLDNNKPFYGNELKPLGANFYPADMTKEEFQDWITKHPEDKEKFTSEFTVIRRQGDRLSAIPYTEEYKEDLSRAAGLLREAAQYTENPSLKKYLGLRATAFETNDYYQSDMAWMDLKDNKIEFIIGPYEVYEDELFNYKASYESFLTIKDPVESEKLAKFGSYLKEIEENLPLEEKYKNSSRGMESPIVVVQEIYSAGDTRAGIQTLAFNLPNDERVRAAKGSKKVMLKNLHEAKFEMLLKPIAKLVLDESQLKYVTFDGFFNHTLMHEMSHGVGPGFITVNGEKTEVQKALKETYSKLEECKADVLGMYNNIFMIKKGVYPKEFANETWVTFLAGIFRSVRFGVNEAHGAGNAIIYNFLLEKGGYEFDNKTEKVRVNFEKVYPALKELAEKILTIQATGDYEASKALIAKYGVESPSMALLRYRLKSLPVDIRPLFHIEEQMK